MENRVRPAWILVAALACTACGAAKFSPRIIAAAEAPDAGPGETVRLAELQFRQGNVALALQQYRKAMRASPADIDAYIGVAACYDRMGRFELSRRYYEEALALDPSDKRVRHNFALSLRLQGRGEEAARFIAESGPPPVQPAASITIALPPPREEPPQPAPATVRLERLSLNEVAIFTAAPAKRAAVTVAELGATLMRATGREVEWRLDDAPPPPATHRLRLLNGVGRRGLAARMRGYLGRRDFSRIAIGDATLRPRRSVIVYPKGARAAAGALAERLPFPARLHERAEGKDMLLMLGKDSLAFDDRLQRRARAS